MRRLWLNGVFWAIFALLTLAGGYAMLRACDLGIFPLFGASACAAPPVDPMIAAERARQDKLRADLHAAEVQLALLPVCPKPLPPKPAEPAKPPGPTKLPEPLPEPTKQPEPPPAEKFEIPKKVEDLKGCWQSVRGDIQITTDDAAQKPIGTARICYCFRNDGHGVVQIRYTDGDICRAPLVAKINPDRVLMHHDNVYCHKHTFNVGADIACGKDQSEETTCEVQNLGRLHNKWSEQFVRVSDEYCGWSG